jgi:hypothetical protein
MAGLQSGPVQPRTFIQFDGVLGRIEDIFNLIAAASILILMLLGSRSGSGPFLQLARYPASSTSPNRPWRFSLSPVWPIASGSAVTSAWKSCLGKLEGRALWIARRSASS